MSENVNSLISLFQPEYFDDAGIISLKLNDLTSSIHCASNAAVGTRISA